MEWNTILAPLDGSPQGEAALPYAVALARATGAAIELFSAIAPHPRGLTARSERVAAELEQRTDERLRAYLDTAAAELRERGLSVQTRIVKGDPAAAVLAAAGEARISLIAMSTHGRHGSDRVDRWSLGGVADKVMRMAACPTVLVRLPYTRAGGRSPRTVEIDRLLVPLDGSPLAESVLPDALELAAQLKATVALVRVEPWLTEGAAPYGTIPEFTQLEDDAAAEAQSYLDRVCEQIPATVTCETVVLRGQPAESLIDFALHERIDLVVIATHGRGGWQRLVIGSTAERVLRAGVPSLLVRPRRG